MQQLAEVRPPQATQAIYSSQGVKLIERGATVDQRLYDRLMRHQLAAPLEDSLEAQDSVSGRVLRATAEKLIERRPILGYMLESPTVRATLLDALEAMPLPPPIAFKLSVARDVHPALFQYNVCAALIAGWLATGPNALRYDVSMVVAAGMLQDLGMMHVDPVLLQPEGTLTREQRRQLYSHPLVSALLLERHHEYPRELIRAVREHHEMLDGSGYPAGLTADKISAWGRILSLAQVVSALLRPGRGLSSLRLSLLLRTNRHQFDVDLGERVLAVVQQLGRDSVPATPTEMASLEPVASPANKLIAMDTLLSEWPGERANEANTTPARRAGMAALGQQCEQMRRLLADVGASADQLTQLGDGFDDEVLTSELSLVAQEMAWQLRTLTRQVGRRWAATPGEALPKALQDWVRQVQDCIGDLVEI
ncbi:HD-GYP domain-containing protein [Pseudorhodoferax sp. Leaf267]|uniref:HD-GYP domain-containing protein n=1 Tax=Pseudorhodoferax sp. Leaf267 TaxID=1736316 RepID=UPI0006F9A8E3|nr:HD domain-containing phosphohydrolase [Pseudorhodoferax sp. Leaf267]KQP23045.1 hypothetical protein ASF43_03940 [Pseudorhodoferax sp. Leaf267]